MFSLIPQEQSVLDNVVIAGYITEVGISLPTNIFTVLNSPLTTSGTISATLVSQTNNTFFAAPSANGVPSFRAIGVDDLPNISANKINSGILGIAHGGTGAATIIDARSSLEAAKSGINDDISSLGDLTSINSFGELAITAAHSITLNAGSNGFNVLNGITRFKGIDTVTNNTYFTIAVSNANTDYWKIGNAVSTNDTTRIFEIYDPIAGQTRFNIDSIGTVGTFGNFFSRALTNQQSRSIAAQSHDYETCYREAKISYYGTLYPGNIFGDLPYSNLGSLAFNNVDNGVIYTNTATPLIFGTNHVERVRIDPIGNVGINQENPTQPLTFATLFGSKIALYGTTPNHYGFGVHSSGKLRYYTDSPQSDHSFGFGNEDDFTENVRITGTGDLIVYNGDLIVRGHVISDGITTTNANNGIKVFYSMNPPPGEIASEGDLWLDTNNHWHKFVNGQWVDADFSPDIPTIIAGITTDYYTKIDIDSALAQLNNSLVTQVSSISSFSFANIQNLFTVYSSLTSTEASDYLTLSSRLSTLSADTNAQILQESITRTTETSALAGQFTTLSVLISTDTAGLNARIDDEISTRASETSAIASDVTTLAASVTSLSATAAAEIQDTRTAVATLSSAEATDILSLTAQVTSVSATAYAQIISEQTARTSQGTALSNRIDSVVAGTYVQSGQHVYYSVSSPAISSSSVPTGAIANDLWLRATDSHWFTLSGGTWVQAQDVDIQGAFAAVNTLQTATTSADNALGQRIDTVNALVINPFTAAQTWEYQNTTESWTVTGATYATSSDYITLTSTSSDPNIAITSITNFSGGLNNRVRARVRRRAGAGWDGLLYWITSGHGFSGTTGQFSTATSAVTALSSWQVIEWDLSNTTDWLSNTITGIRVDLGNSSADIFDIDWISIGKISPGTFQSQILNQATTFASATGSLATQVNTLSSTVLGNSASIIDTRTTTATVSGALATAGLMTLVNGQVAGYSIYNGASGTSIDFVANKVKFTSGTNSLSGATLAGWQTAGTTTIAGGAITAGTINLTTAAIQSGTGSTSSLGIGATGKVTFSGSATPPNAGLWMSPTNLGFTNGTSWKTYMDSSGNFFLSNRTGGGQGLSWDGTNLTINGSITLTNTIAAGKVTGLAATATSSDFSSVTGITKPANNATVGATFGSNLEGGPFATPAGSGLFIDATHIGFYANSNWRTYMDSSGNFHLSNSTGTINSLTWNGTTLTIIGNGTFSGAINASSGAFTGGVSVGTGSFSAGGGNVVLDANGLRIASTANTPWSSSNALSWKVGGTGNLVGFVQTSRDSSGVVFNSVIARKSQIGDLCGVQLVTQDQSGATTNTLTLNGSGGLTLSSGSFTGSGSGLTGIASGFTAGRINNNFAGSAAFFWQGQSGQPAWLFGSNDGTNIYVWNPSNFDVNHATYASYANGQYLYWIAGNTSTAFITFDTASNHFYIPNNVQIQGTIYPTSSRELKTNITNWSSNASSLQDLQPCSFTYKTNLNQTYLGFIAEEVETVFPELVIGSGVTKGIDMMGLIALLVNAVKDLQQDVTNLKSQITKNT